jgi:2-phosphosulfolactate phosphatase
MALQNEISVEVFLTPSQVEEMQLKDKNVVVIDVLRASTTIATALFHGAKEIIPVSTIENAAKISGNMMGDVTLRAGERNARMIEGFNLGNSPLEYTKEVVTGKSIIFVTTNGSGTIVKGRHAKHLLVGGFVNLGTVVEALAGLKEDVTIICSGKSNNFCLEDAVCAGKIIEELKNARVGNVKLDDAGQAALTLQKSYGKNILKMLKQSEHGQFLVGIGFEEDVKWCAGADTIPVLPVFSGNTIRSGAELKRRPATV